MSPPAGSRAHGDAAHGVEGRDPATVTALPGRILLIPASMAPGTEGARLAKHHLAPRSGIPPLLCLHREGRLAYSSLFAPPACMSPPPVPPRGSSPGVLRTVLTSPLRAFVSVPDPRADAEPCVEPFPPQQ